MSLRITQNVEAVSALRNLSATSNMVATSMQRLSSGHRINAAGDDAAGLAASMKRAGGGLAQAAGQAGDKVDSATSTRASTLVQEHQQAAAFRITDADMADAAVSLASSQLRTQSGTSILAQANQSAQAVLQLVR